MPNPSRSQLHPVNVPLTNISIAYQQSPADFIADRVAPRIPVVKQGDRYHIYDIGDMRRSEARKRAPGTESVGTGWRLSTDTYFCDPWSVHQDVTDQDRANQDTVLSLDRDATEHITQDMLMAREVNWASTFFAASTWTGSTTAGDITPGNLWDTVAGTPIEDMRTQQTSIKKKTAQNGNTLILGVDVYDSLLDHPDILDRMKYTQFGSVTTEILARMFQVDNVYVSRATTNTAAEEATDSIGWIVGSNDALLCHVAPRPGIKVPSAMYTFTWSYNGNNDYGTRIKKFRMEELESDRVEISSAWDHKLIGADLGVYFLNVCTAH